MYIGIVIFWIRDYISRIWIHSILKEFLETSDCTDKSRKDETCLQLKMKKHFIKTGKISLNLGVCICSKTEASMIQLFVEVPSKRAATSYTLF